ncbi:MAG: FAD-binding protein [Planctomycetota bacterium]|nr:MAG: FAD-binding protein [Planctomycetota bacterium]
MRANRRRGPERCRASTRAVDSRRPLAPSTRAVHSRRPLASPTRVADSRRRLARRMTDPVDSANICSKALEHSRARTLPAEARCRGGGANARAAGSSGAIVAFARRSCSLSRPMPREVVLHQPPSSEPLVLEGDALVDAAARVLRVDRSRIAEARLSKLSFDARVRERRWRMSVDVWMKGEPLPAPIRRAPPDIARPRERAPTVAVIGSGPAGLFAALDLLAAGLNVVLVERGRDVQSRRRDLAQLNRGAAADPDSNYCFGEGGAGTYSDGKLYTRSGVKSEVRAVLEALVAHGAREDILASWRPHIGSNKLPDVVRALRATLERAGARVLFETRAERIEVAATSASAGVSASAGRGGVGGPRVAAVHVRSIHGGAGERIACDALVLATGHSANDAVAMAAAAGAALAPKGFAMGVRIEHAQDWLDARQYGGLREHCELPASFYELRHQSDGRGVYSFCMCPGGFIVPATTRADAVVVNGMSLARRDSPFANSGLVVQLEPEDWCGERAREWGFDELVAHAAALRPSAKEFLRPGVSPATPDEDPLAGARVQLALELVAADAGGGGQRAPALRADAFAAFAAGAVGEALPEPLATSYQPGLRASSLGAWLPRGLALRLAEGLRAFDARLTGFASERGQLVGVESRTSSPVRVLRDEETLEAVGVAGLYPCGEGAGYAGGIVSAALDGRRAAAAVARRLAPAT